MPSNRGRFETNRFSLVPEFGVTVGYQVTDWFRIYAGYNLLYIGDVMRPGDQMDRVVNTSQITRRPVGARRPMTFQRLGSPRSIQYWRTSLTADSIASDPPLQKKAQSRPGGVNRAIRAARRSCGSFSKRMEWVNAIRRA